MLVDSVLELHLPLVDQYMYAKECWGYTLFDAGRVTASLVIDYALAPWDEDFPAALANAEASANASAFRALGVNIS